MPSEPQSPQKSPYMVDEEAGTKWWCACGRSQNQPYCDGSHAGTGITPVKAELDAPKRVAYCGCKRTGTPPYCDGTHSKL